MTKRFNDFVSDFSILYLNRGSTMASPKAKGTGSNMFLTKGLNIVDLVPLAYDDANMGARVTG